MRIEDVHGIGEWTVEKRGKAGEDGNGGGSEDLIYKTPEGKVFLVVRPKTIEVRCDAKLSGVLREEYESVMESRYFGRGGIEIVPSGQLSDTELEDLVRLSYNLSI